jgi:replicative DNA helicase
MAEVVKRIDYLASHQGELMGVPSGFRLLDKLLGGFQKSDLIILAARPSGGKTSLALNIAVSAAKRYGQRVAFFSLEMSAEQLVQRLLAAETGINQQRLRLGQVNEDEWPLLMEAAGVLSSTSMFIDDTPALSAMELRTKARRVHAEFGLDLIVVDYLQLMRGDTRSENRVQEVSYISRSLKGLARELNVPVLALSQLSRAVESRQDKRPMLSDLRESGCLTGDVLVTLADSGRNVPIRDLEGKSDFNVWALDLQTLKLERTPVSRAFTTGIKPVYRLKTRLGRTVRATAHHCFLTIQGWKRLDELKTGDFIALPRRLDSPAKQTMSNAEMALLGHLLGDGCTLPRHVIQYTTREKDLAETVASLAREVFGKEVNPRIAHGSIQLIKGKRVRPIIYYATSSLRLAHDVQALLLRLSINAILSQHAQNGKGRDQHHVTVTGKSDLERFAERIGAVGQYQMHKAIDTAYCGTALYKQNVSRERAARVAKVVQSAELAAMAESDIYWDSIISIEPDGVEQVFDLTVPGYHNFVANNIIVHNSLEQDADIVMFIYREDMYDEGTDRQNIADIIIAKHRNGPTGIVSLYFKKELTQFMELELHREELNVPEFE